MHFQRSLTIAGIAVAFASLSVHAAQPTESAQSLFNGTDLRGWHADVPEADNKPDLRSSFIVRDGMLVSLGRPLGHLITNDDFEKYRLDIEYRFAGEPGNCGVLVHASTPRELYGMFPKSIEVQMYRGNAGDFWCIGENIAVDNMADRRAGEPETWGGQANQSRRVLNLTDDSENPIGDWNRMIIECLDDRVRVWVNGDLVNDGFDCTAQRGRIAVQAEGAEVEFRKLNLTPISQLSPKDAKLGVLSQDAIEPTISQEDPVRVFILAGQSNMEGKAQVALLDRQIQKPENAVLFERFCDGDEYRVRDDVWINYLNRRGALTVGYGSPDRIGAELAFGTVMGDHFNEPVLLIKTAWGGKSIQRDFRPPSAGLPSAQVLDDILTQTNENRAKNNQQALTLDDIRATYGHFYRAMIDEVQTALKDMDERFPSLAGREYELSGLVWFQGWNDQYNGAELEYESNLAHFINDVRSDLDAPQLPVVIGVMGQNGSSPATGAMLTIQQAQLAVPGHLALDGTVRAVRTDLLVDAAAEALYPSWKERRDEWDQIGSDHPYHYYGSAVWFTRIGSAFADAMLDLLGETSHD